jgi:hypothetical protein
VAFTLLSPLKKIYHHNKQVKMTKKEKKELEPFNFPPIGKAILYFVILFIVVEVLISLLRLGTETLMRAIGAGANLRVFLGETLSRALMIILAVFLTSLAMKKA